MILGTSSTFSKPSCIINFNSSTSFRTSLASKSRLFHLQQLQYGFHYYDPSSMLSYQRKNVMTVYGSIESTPPPSSTPPSNPFPGLPGRKGWITGLVISLLLPFLRNKWGPLFSLKSEIDRDLEILEDTVEVLEKVAESVDKMAEEVAEDLPEGKLKHVAIKIEQVAEIVAQTAHLTDTAIDKVQELEDELVSYISENKTNLDETPEAMHGRKDED